MAILSEKKVKSLIASPKNRESINLAVLQEEKLMMHCEPILEKYNLPFTSYRYFTNWWESLIASEKYKRIDNLICTPLSTVSITSDIFSQLQKFVDAQDRYIRFDFSNPDYTNDYAQFLERSNDEMFWKNTCMHSLRTDICSMVVTDLPAIQISERPEPYNYIVPSRMFIDVDINQYTGNVEYFIFRQQEGVWDDSLIAMNTNSRLNLIKEGDDYQKIIAIDDVYYRVLVKTKALKEFEIMHEVEHGLGLPCNRFLATFNQRH